MATGFVSEIEIWEVDIYGIPIARFVDESSADEYIRQIKEEAETNVWIRPYVDTAKKYPCSISKFVGHKGGENNA